MGDRGNIVIETNGDRIYLYSHWSGRDLPTILKNALASKQGRGRWNDESYLTKIIFGFMLEGNDPKDEIGFGISTTLGDGEYALLVVNVDLKKVYLESDGSHEIGQNTQSWSFEEYAALPNVDWEYSNNYKNIGLTTNLKNDE